MTIAAQQLREQSGVYRRIVPVLEEVPEEPSDQSAPSEMRRTMAYIFEECVVPIISGPVEGSDEALAELWPQFVEAHDAFRFLAEQARAAGRLPSGLRREDVLPKYARLNGGPQEEASVAIACRIFDNGSHVVRDFKKKRLLRPEDREQDRELAFDYTFYSHLFSFCAYGLIASDAVTDPEMVSHLTAIARHSAQERYIAAMAARDLRTEQSEGADLFAGIEPLSDGELELADCDLEPTG